MAPEKIVVKSEPKIIIGLPRLKTIVKEAAKNDMPNKNKIIEIKDMVRIIIFLEFNKITISRLKKYIDTIR